LSLTTTAVIPVWAEPKTGMTRGEVGTAATNSSVKKAAGPFADRAFVGKLRDAQEIPPCR